MNLLSSLTLAATIVVGIAGVADSASAPIVGTAGQTSAIDGWSIQASAKVSGDLATVSQPGFDVSSWYRMGSHGTVMVGVY
jgi:exo-1,4-beta-D-glucosaminidase